MRNGSVISAVQLETRTALSALVVFSVLLGLAYPALITIIGGWVFPRQSQGSLIERNGEPIGSALIGQQFDDPRYFWGRPSATPLFPYNAAASGGSNYGPANPVFLSGVAARIQRLRAADPANTDAIPSELVTASASGLDPQISPATAYFQVERVARARAVPIGKLRALVKRCTAERQYGVLGEARVNVLELNMALDQETKGQ